MATAAAVMAAVAAGNRMTALTLTAGKGGGRIRRVTSGRQGDTFRRVTAGRRGGTMAAAAAVMAAVAAGNRRVTAGVTAAVAANKFLCQLCIRDSTVPRTLQSLACRQSALATSRPKQ